jgi:major membrane immunogen (membrane-anchored lipoprotein)
MKKNYISIIILAVALITAISIFATSKDKSSNKRKAITDSIKQIAVNDSQELNNKNVLQKKLKKKIQSFRIYKASNKYEGIIGNFKNNKSDNPSDNIFHITIDKDLSLNTSVYLEYELYGLQDYTSVCRSVNDQLTTGGYFVKKSEGWSKQSEQLSIKQLKQGKNIIRFTVPENAEYAYKVRNVCLLIKPAVSNESRRLVINQPNTFTFFQKFGYLQGFVSGKGSETAQLEVNGKALTNNNGNFEGLANKSTLDSNAWKATVIATFEDGMQLKTEFNYQKSVEYDYTYNFNNHIKQSLQQAEPEKEINFIHEGLQLSGKAQSVKNKCSAISNFFTVC